MHGLLSFSRSWRDPVQGLRRAAALLTAVAALEGAAILLQRQVPWLSSIYVLALLRSFDILLLLVWGPWPLSGRYLQDNVKESLPIALFLGLCGAILLVLGKVVQGYEIRSDPRFIASPLAPFLLTSCLLAPVAEELVFRGILYRVAREWLNAVICTLVVSVLFAALHLPFHQSVILPFCGSLIFCLVYEKTKLILTPILVHITGNLLIYVLPPLLR